MNGSAGRTTYRKYSATQMLRIGTHRPQCTIGINIMSFKRLASVEIRFINCPHKMRQVSYTRCPSRIAHHGPSQLGTRHVQRCSVEGT